VKQENVICIYNHTLNASRSVVSLNSNLVARILQLAGFYKAVHNDAFGIFSGHLCADISVVFENIQYFTQL